MSLIYCELNLVLSWYVNSAISSIVAKSNAAIYVITNTKLKTNQS